MLRGVQNIIIARPYRFIPPHTGDFWPRLFKRILPSYLRRSFGITRVETRGLEKLRASLDAKHGIMLAPNHCRPGDPFVLGLALGEPIFVMASWHLFMQNRLQSFLLPRVGVFSIYREGLDREALKCAIQILAAARRPLVVFPEGVISRHNDRLNNLMEGTALMLRSAAKQRAQQGGRVVCHPIAIRYFFEGDLESAVKPVLFDIERRLSWRPDESLPLAGRVRRAGGALLALKEIEYFGQPQAGELAARIAQLIDRVLEPLEKEWLKGRKEPDVVQRVKLLRTAILPDLVAEKLDEAETARRWRQLADVYFAQQLACYPAGYFGPAPTPERILETVERFEEDLTDDVRIHAPFRAVVTVGEAIEVSPERQRAEADPVMTGIREQLEGMLAATAAEQRVP